MTRLNLGSGGYPLDGYDNLDAATGWRFQDGLAYPDASVECASASHSLMFLPLADWPALFAEVARVLEPGGVFRVTEDSTDDPASERHGGHPDAVTLTTSRLVREHMAVAGLAACPVWPDQTAFRDRSLIQNFHGGVPKCFFVEGVKPRKLR